MERKTEGAEKVTDAKVGKDGRRKKDHKGDKIGLTQIDEGGGDKERGSGEEEKGENSFSKPARRRVPAVFI